MYTINEFEAWLIITALGELGVERGTMNEATKFMGRIRTAFPNIDKEIQDGEKEDKLLRITINSDPQIKVAGEQFTDGVL